MPDFNPRPDGPAEELLQEVFQGRLADADSQMARLRLERRLAAADLPSQHQLRPSFRLVLRFMLSAMFIVVFGGWASSISLKPWDDAQQVTLALPEGWSPAEYPHLTGLMRKYSDQLYELGAHSLIVDYKQSHSGAYYLELGILGIDYSKASDWTRSLLRSEPQLSSHGYAITQPLVPYVVTVGDMLAFRLTGKNTAVEANVVSAWLAKQNAAEIDGAVSQSGSGHSARVYLITRDTDYARRISMVDF
jgi:hypothetical protein